MPKLSDKHLFAIFTDFSFPISTQLVLTDTNVLTRITKVLRLRAGEHVILFNATEHCIVRVEPTTFTQHKAVHGTILERHANTPLAPSITLLQALPKKSVFEEILYNAAQLGVHTIVPLSTSKSHDLPFTEREMTRFRSIMIAACEQAKQFFVPLLLTPQPFTTLHQSCDSSLEKIIFDSTGKHLAEALPSINKAKKIAVLFGPEGGLTVDEIKAAEDAKFSKVRLTQTILRSEDAPLVGIGILRSLIA